MALSGDALQAILAANSEANRQAMAAMGDTFATSFREKSAEDQARMDALLQKMQDRIDKQDETMQAELMLTPLDFNGSPGEFQVSLHTRMDVEKRALWQARLASELLMDLNAEKLQSMRAGPVKLAMQQMMGVTEREFTDGDDGVTHEQIINQVHEELGAIHCGQVAREALADLQTGSAEPKRPACWAKPTDEEETTKPKPPTGGGASLRQGGRGLGRGGRGGARGGAGRGSGGDREPGAKRVCSCEAVQKGSCPFRDDCRFLEVFCLIFKDSALALNQFRPDTTA